MIFDGKREAWKYPCPFQPQRRPGFWERFRISRHYHSIDGHNLKAATYFARGTIISTKCTASDCPVYRFAPGTTLGWCGAGGEPQGLAERVKRWHEEMGE